MQQPFIAGRRRVLVALAASPLVVGSINVVSAAPAVSVFKLVGCGCCDQWAAHLRKNGFAVSVSETPDLSPVRRNFGVSKDFDTCHTAMVEGYVIEGHVPAADIQRLLKSKARVAGLVVPGMPNGSPGMEGPTRDPYDVLSFDRDGATRIYARYR